MYIDATKSGDHIISWIRDQDENLITVQEPTPYYCYIESPKGEYRSMYGHSLARVDFENYRKFRDYREGKETLFESDISPLYKYLSDEFYGTEGGTVRVGLYDIEVHPHLEREKGYPTHEDPHGEVNGISLFDKYNQCYHQWLLNAPNIWVKAKDGRPVKHHHCDSEFMLINSFFTEIEDIDVLSAWNGDGYDIPYIIARTVRIMGADYTKHLCRGGFKPRMFETQDQFNNDVVEYGLVGRIHLDTLKLYKKFTFEEKGSYKLSNIAHEDVGEEKIEFDGDLGELYENDPQTFYDYSLHDTFLLVALDEKHSHIELAITMARRATVRFTDVLTTLKYLEHTIMNYAHFEREEPLILPDKPGDTVKEKYPGAFVLPTRKGVYGWSMSVDLTSLYPSVMMSLGISPETMVMQCEGRHQDFVRIVEKRDTPIAINLIHTDGRREPFEVSAAELNDIIREEGYTLSANGTVFNGKDGLIPEVLRVWFSERKRLKGLKAEAGKNGDKEGKQFYDMRQHIEKINLNSLYGAIANKHCRFFEIDLARSITLTGQEIGKYQTMMADQLIEGDANE